MIEGPSTRDYLHSGSGLRGITPEALGSAKIPVVTERAVPSTARQGSTRFAERTRAKHARIHELKAVRHSLRAIARPLRMGDRTVIRYAHTASPEELLWGRWTNKPSAVDDFKPYLHQRWQEVVPTGRAPVRAGRVAGSGGTAGTAGTVSEQADAARAGSRTAAASLEVRVYPLGAPGSSERAGHSLRDRHLAITATGAAGIG